MRKNILIFKCIIVIEIKNKNLTIIELNYKRKLIFEHEQIKYIQIQPLLSYPSRPEFREKISLILLLPSNFCKKHIEFQFLSKFNS